MNIAPVAYRYASSLLQLSAERGSLASTQTDMLLIASTCAKEQALRSMLKSPVIKPDAKGRVLEQVFGQNVSEVTSRFMAILVRKGREGLLPDVAAAFGELHAQKENILSCQVSSAVVISDDVRQRVRQFAQGKFPGKSIVLSEKVDPSLIGGIVIRIGDEQLDASVSRRLHDLRRKFSENPYIPEI
jgi:F-type H+-transporting ATPase subunit delta